MRITQLIPSQEDSYIVINNTINLAVCDAR